jgi:hypothetical protein
MPIPAETKALIDRVSELLHNGQTVDAARLLVKSAGRTDKVDNKTEAFAALTPLLHYCLNNEGMVEAAQLLWSPTLFTPKPESTARVWRAFDTEDFILLMGAASMSKSYSMGVRLMLEWIRDPEFTTVQVIGPSENHLEDNLFSHLVELHRNATIPLPGVVGKLFIGIDPRKRRGAIRGVVVPLGKKSAGRIQGTKRFPRKKPHPVFGTLSRMFIFLDEMVNIPKGIWKDVDNVLANAQGDHGLKVIGAFNPTDPTDEVGRRCEPKGGWAQFEMDRDFDWKSTRGWRVVRLDAKFSENVQAGKKIFEGLQTKEGFDLIISNSGGTESAGYYTMARGCFPPSGVSMVIISAGMLNKFKAEFIWLETPEECAGFDPALQGKDCAYFAKGKFGVASGIKMPPTLDAPKGTTIFFKNRSGNNTPRWALQLEALFKMPKPQGDSPSQEMAEAVVRLCKQLFIKPAWLCMDRTGNGAGVHDIIKYLWSTEVQGVNYSEGCSDRKIMVEDTKTPEELYDRVQSELWFLTRKLIEFDYAKVLPSADTAELFSQLGTRWFRATGKISKVESKDDYQLRNQAQSPDQADAFTLMCYGARNASQVTFGMTPENSSADGYDEDDDMPDYRVDVTNRTESLPDDN